MNYKQYYSTKEFALSQEVTYNIYTIHNEKLNHEVSQIYKSELVIYFSNLRPSPHHCLDITHVTDIDSSGMSVLLAYTTLSSGFGYEPQINKPALLINRQPTIVERMIRQSQWDRRFAIITALDQLKDL